MPKFAALRVGKWPPALVPLALVLATLSLVTSARPSAQASPWQVKDVAALDLGAANCLRYPRVNGFDFAPDGTPIIGWTQVEGCGGNTWTAWAEERDGAWQTTEFPLASAGWYNFHELGLGGDGRPYMFVQRFLNSNYDVALADLRAGSVTGVGDYLGPSCLETRFRLATMPGQAWPSRAMQLIFCSGSGPLRLDGTNLIENFTNRGHDYSIGPSGQAHIAYVDGGGGVHYLRPGRTPVRVATVNRFSDDIGIAEGADGVIHMVVRGFDTTADYDRAYLGYLRSTDDGLTWTYVDRVDANPNQWGLSLQVDADGKPTVAYWYYNQLTYATRASGAWVKSVVATPVWAGVEWLTQPRLRFDSFGIPHVAYYDWTANRIRIAAPEFYEPPTITNPGDQGSVEGDTVSLAIAGSVGDGKVRGFMATGLPPGLAIGSSTGMISGTIAVGSAGQYPVTVTISDGIADASAQFVWTVAAPPPPLVAPTLALPGGYSYAADAYGVELTYDIVATTTNAGATLLPIAHSPLPAGATVTAISETGPPASRTYRFAWTPQPAFNADGTLVTSRVVCYSISDSAGQAMLGNACVTVTLPPMPDRFAHGTLSWARDPLHVSATTHKVRITFDGSYRRSFAWPSGTPQVGTVLTGLVTLDLAGAGYLDTVTPEFTVASVNAADDFFTGTAVVDVEIPIAALPVTVAYDDCCRLETLLDGNANTPFKLSTIITPAATVTRSPISTVAPRVHVTVNQPVAFQLPATAYDGLTNRFAVTPAAISGLVAPHPGDAPFISSTGLISWTPAGEGLHAVQFTITAVNALNLPQVSTPVEVIFDVQAPCTECVPVTVTATPTVTSPVGVESRALVAATASLPTRIPELDYTALATGMQLRQLTTGQTSTWELVWTPEAGQPSALVCFQARDGGIVSPQACSVFEIVVNEPPVAVDDVAEAEYQQPVTVLLSQLLANDTDGDGDALTVTSVGSAVNGSVVLGAGHVVFTPDAGFSGSASFSYQVSDGKGGSDSAVVNVMVTLPPPPMPPVWVEQFAGTPAGRFRALDAVSATHAWAVHDSGLLHTADGGTTWYEQFRPPTGWLAAVEFVDAQHGWVAGATGQGGAVYATSDGGATWTRQALPDEADLYYVNDLAFVDAMNGWALSGDRTYTTSDGGATWTRRDTNAPSCDVISAVSTTRAWASCARGMVIGTTDGGLTWSAPPQPFAYNSDLTVYGIKFIDAERGWVWSNEGVKSTADGGRSWQAMTSPGFYVSDIAFLDDQRGWVVGGRSGAGGVIAATTDGGQTWITEVDEADGYAWFYLVSFVDATHGWSIGDSGAILAYAPDSGARTLSVKLTGTGSGEVSSAPAAIACGTTCAAALASGTNVVLTATPAASSRFSRWSGVCTGGGDCPVMLAASRRVTAVFTLTAPLTVAVQGDGDVASHGGAIDCGQTCEARVDVGAPITLTATPRAGSWFAGWSGGCTSTAAQCTIVVNGASSATAIFRDGPPPPPFPYVAGLWTAQSTGITGGEFRAMDAVSSTHAWALHDTTALWHTADGGATWREQWRPAIGWLAAVEFVDAAHGWVAGATGQGGAVYATSDGGATWTRQTLPGEADRYYVNDLAFTSALEGWALAAEYVYTTSDGGATWTPPRYTGMPECYAISAVSATRAWAACARGMVIGTTDGGLTWSAPQLPFGDNRSLFLDGLTFLDDQQGWLWSNDGLARTTTGGVTWQRLSGPGFQVQDAIFTDRLHGWAVGGSLDWTTGVPVAVGMIAATTDGGLTWQTQVGLAEGQPSLSAVAFADGNRGWAAGFDGVMLHYGPPLPTRALTVARAGSGSGVVTSQPQGIDCGEACSAAFAEGTVVTLTASPSGTDVFTGWSGACSGTGACNVTMTSLRNVTATFLPTFRLSVSVVGTGAVSSSPAGLACPGVCEARFTIGTPVTLSAAAAAGSWFTGWSGACGSSAPACTAVMNTDQQATAIFRDGPPPPPFPYVAGLWTAQSPGITGGEFREMDAVSSTHAWALHDTTALWHTADGGATWREQWRPAIGWLAAVEFVDAAHGWVAGATGQGGAVYATSDGGATWTQQTLPSEADLYFVPDLSFVNTAVGWAVSGNRVFTTEDGGATWTGRDTNGPHCHAISAVSATQAWAACGYGVVIGTRDGGLTWSAPQLPFGYNASLLLDGLTFLDDQQGWLWSNDGLARTTNGGVTWQRLSGPGFQVQDAIFTDRLHGWAVGGSLDWTTGVPVAVGMIAATADGGLTWQTQVVDHAAAPLYGLAFADGNHGWAVGADATILAYRPANTPVGSDVTVAASGALPASPVSVMFSSVTAPGMTTYAVTNGPAAPAGFQFGAPPTTFDISTTAQYVAPLEVCISYSGTTFADPAALRMFHYEGGQWLDRTTSVNTTTRIVCGTVSSLSPFALAEPVPAPAAIPGIMHGEGGIDAGGKSYRFNLDIDERRLGRERGGFELSVRTPKSGKKKETRDEFEMTRVNEVEFRDDPAFKPARQRKNRKAPAADSVTFSGSGKWNGSRGYTFEARATDQGEPGRHRDRFRITIYSPTGAVVATVDETIDQGNLQSERLKPEHWRR